MKVRVSPVFKRVVVSFASQGKALRSESYCRLKTIDLGCLSRGGELGVES